MNNDNVTINEMVARMLSEIERLGYTETSIWKNFFPKFRLVAAYYEKKGVSVYDPKITDEYVSFQNERLDRKEITIHYYKRVKYAASRMNEFYLTGTIHINAPKRGSRYTISDRNERLIDQFLEHKGYGLNTRDDVRWVIRKYIHYFEKNGHESLETVTIDESRKFILDAAAEVKASSLHNILLYLRHFHIFLKEAGIAAPDCIHLYSYKICREMPIQSYVTDEDLRKILGVIDTSSGTGKRDRAIILTAATTGLRASDIIRLKLSDIDWRKGEIRVVQKKTGRTVYCPIVSETGDALQDYILNARPSSGCEEVFLRACAPRTAIMDAVCIGSMFLEYQKKAGVERHAFDGKGFHGLRRRLAKKLIVSGTPTTTISQILGHSSPDAIRQYISLDTSNIKECALDFRGILVERREFS